MRLPFLEQFGPMGLPLLICAALMAAIIIERLIFFGMTRPISQTRLEQLTQRIRGGVTETIDDKVRKSYFGRVLLNLISQRSSPEKEREKNCSLQLMSVENHLSRFLPILKTLTTISPLLGLLGTVLGMIEAFQSISAINRPITPSLVANGVSQALLTTAVGLFLAIPALVAHSLFQIRIGQLIHRLTIQLNIVNTEIERSDEKNETAS
jgi:biopolymer transport protein ExbB